MAHVMQGRHDQAGQCARRAGALVDELGASVFTKVAQGQMAGYIHMLAGDWRSAEKVQRQCFAFLEQQNDKAWLASLAPMLGLTLLEQGMIEEAEYYTRIAEQVSADDDFDAQARWRNTRAAILIRQNRNEEAAEVADEACRVVAKTDILDLHADALALRGQAQGKLGLRSEAARSVDQAVTLYERKGNLVSAARAHAILVELKDAQ
jgi:tetratricopeptide (TPR) repeat protein